MWALLSGREGGINNLAFAASMPEFPPEQGGNGIDMFDVVFKSLKEVRPPQRLLSLTSYSGIAHRGFKTVKREPLYCLPRKSTSFVSAGS